MRTVAIIGSGIAGMACAWFLRKTHAVTLFEKNDIPGGHTCTRSVCEGEREVPIDTGFMVYNEHTYPNLLRFFDHLGVQNAIDTNMSFGIQVPATRLAYACSGANSFFAQRARLLSPRHWRLFAEIVRFFREANRFLEQGEDHNTAETLGEFLREHQFSDDLVFRFVVPMTGAIWSTPPAGMLEYPVATLLRFMKNHGLLGIGTQFQWKTLLGGSRTYRDKVLQAIEGNYHTARGAAKVLRTGHGASVIDVHGRQQEFDLCVIATHADEALTLLPEPEQQEKKLLSSFPYNTNPVVLHRDARVMPRCRRAWASWNYRIEQSDKGVEASTHYWMNSLQSLDSERNYFVSVDYTGEIDRDLIEWQTVFTHPRFNVEAIESQSELHRLNEKPPLYYCGSYFRYGFHEDALSSALDVVRAITGKEPWSL